MPVAHVLITVLPLALPPQGPAPGEVGKFRWPPTTARTLHYEAKLTKERKLPREVEKAEKAARKAAGLFLPSRAAKRSVRVDIGITLEVKGNEILGRFTPSLGKHTLRIDVPKSGRGSGTRGTPVEASVDKNATTALPNQTVDRVWGLPASKTETNLVLDRPAVQAFEHTFRAAGGRGHEPADLRAAFGDHLIPVLWTYPLPCWIGQLVHTLDLGGEAVIGGKALIRNDSQQLKVGYRHTRVDGMFTAASAEGFTLKYKLQVEQFLPKVQSQRPLTESLRWAFEVEGVATYSFRDQAWDSISEKVTAKPKDELSDAKLRAIWDEFHTGTIEIKRVAGKSGRGGKSGKSGKSGGRAKR